MQKSPQYCAPGVFWPSVIPNPLILYHNTAVHCLLRSLASCWRWSNGIFMNVISWLDFRWLLLPKGNWPFQKVVLWPTSLFGSYGFSWWYTPQKNCNQFFAAISNLNFSTAMWTVYMHAESILKGHANPLFYWVQIESSTSCTVQIVQVFFGKENVAKTFYWYCFVFYFVTTPFCAFCWIKKMRWDGKSTRVERDEEKMQITDERYVEKALSFTI